MKKTVALFIGVFFIAMLAQAQAPLEQKEMQINVGTGWSHYGMPFYGELEYGIGHNISVGGDLNYRSYEGNYRSYSVVTFAAFGNYHFNQLLKIPSKWDVYSGLSFGYSSWSIKKSSIITTGEGKSGIYFLGYIGGRYFVKDNIGFNVELSVGNYAGGRIGITVKI